MRGGGSFSDADHLRALSEERRNGKKDQDAAYEFKLKGLLSDLKVNDKRLLLRDRSMGSCLSVCGTTVSGTVLSTMEFRDFYVRVIMSLP